MLTNEEEAVMNMELFKTDELFKQRVELAVLDMTYNNAEFKRNVERIMEVRLMNFRESLAQHISNAVRNTY